MVYLLRRILIFGDRLTLHGEKQSKSCRKRGPCVQDPVQGPLYLGDFCCFPLSSETQGGWRRDSVQDTDLKVGGVATLLDSRWVESRLCSRWVESRLCSTVRLKVGGVATLLDSRWVESRLCSRWVESRLCSTVRLKVGGVATLLDSRWVESRLCSRHRPHPPTPCERSQGSCLAHLTYQKRKT